MPKDRSDHTHWQRRPSTEDTGIRYPIWRVSARGKHRVVILSHDLIGRYTHYWRGRTSPCTMDGCPACADNVTRRWHGWLFTQLLDSPQIGILELTAKATGPVDEYFKRCRTLRGALLYLHRVPSKPNGRVISSLADSGIASTGLPIVPNVQDVLEAMWEISSKKLPKEKPPATTIPIRTPDPIAEPELRDGSHG